MSKTVGPHFDVSFNPLFEIPRPLGRGFGSLKFLSFNPLFEILSTCQAQPRLCTSLSILFLRFLSETGAKTPGVRAPAFNPLFEILQTVAKKELSEIYMSLSILFLRFSHPADAPQAVSLPAFNPLFEIPVVQTSSGYRPADYAFNPLFEIRRIVLM